MRRRTIGAMYLVHARLRAPTGTTLPSDTAEVMTNWADASDRLEHVSVHSRHPEDPGGGSGCVLGLFLRAASLSEAEDTALRLCRRVVAGRSPLRQYAIVSVGVALVPLLWDIAAPAESSPAPRDPWTDPDAPRTDVDGLCHCRIRPDETHSLPPEGPSK